MLLHLNEKSKSKSYILIWTTCASLHIINQFKMIEVLYDIDWLYIPRMVGQVKGNYHELVVYCNVECLISIRVIDIVAYWHPLMVKEETLLISMRLSCVCVVWCPAFNKFVTINTVSNFKQQIYVVMSK